MKKILVYRTIRPETMGIVISDILEEFGHENIITVLTRPENKVTMESISGVSESLVFSKAAFNISEVDPAEIKELKCINEFDISVIPVSGNLDSYDNVVNFDKKTFNSKNIFYYRYPNQFVRHESSFSKSLFKNMLIMISHVLVIPLLLAFSVSVLLDYAGLYPKTEYK